MLFYSNNSGRKIVHSDGCFQIKRVKDDDIGIFHSVDDARQHGYRMCQCCSQTAKHYRIEKDLLIEYCLGRPVSFYFNLYDFTVRTPWSKWKIVDRADNKGMELYHKNTRVRSKDSLSPIEGYHLQRVKMESVIDYLRYIVDHDVYKVNYHPEQLYPQPAKEAPPKKGTKRYKKQQKRLEKQKRKQSIKRVLDIIDNISEKNQGSNLI